jgi:hypothetical protein
MNESVGSKESWLSRGHWVLGLLCVFTFLATVTTGQNVFDNAWLIFWYEAVFVAGFLVFQRVQGESAGPLFPVKSIGFWLLATWFGSITVSLLLSPYGLMTEWFAVQRYFQSIFHLLFFLSVYRFVSIYEGSLKPLFISLAASVAVLAVLFIASWYALDEMLPSDSREWFRRPPCNAHIRITGFLVAAGTVALTPFFIEGKKGKTASGLFYMIGLAVWGLMFWTGGRGSILSVLLVSIMILAVLIVKKQPVKHYLIAVCIFMVGGILLAELFKVFSWNGIFQAAERTVAAGGNPYKLTTGRVKLCGYVIESLNNENGWLFGLGSQGYCYMPNRTFGFQPHNLIFQFLAEWGVAGTALFLAMIGYGFITGAKKRLLPGSGKLSVPTLAALGIILSLGLHSLVDGIFYHAQSSMHLAIAFAVWMSAKRT